MLVQHTALVSNATITAFDLPDAEDSVDSKLVDAHASTENYHLPQILPTLK